MGFGAVLGGLKLSALIGHVAYALILLSVLIASLSALALGAVTQPASNLLNSILVAVPAIFTAMLVLTIAYFVGRVVSGLVAKLLAEVVGLVTMDNVGEFVAIQAAAKDFAKDFALNSPPPPSPASPSTPASASG